MKVTQSLLPFKIELTERPDPVTAHGGLPVVMEAILATIHKSLYRELRDALGYGNWKAIARHLWSLILLVVAGGDHLSDLDALRADKGLEKLLGFKISSPSQVKEILYAFHQDRPGHPLTAEQDAELSRAGKAQIRPEGPALMLLDEFTRLVMNAIQTAHPRATATLDVDATIIEAHKKTALKAYEGTVGYQPQMAWWAEVRAWVCDEFRDGNVPAAFAVKDFVVRSFARLPSGLVRRRLRADSALYDEGLLSWAAREEIEFAVTADMSEGLAERIRELPEPAWTTYKEIRDPEHLTEEREWADVTFIPDWKRNRDPNNKPFRYIAIRVRPRQRELFSDADRQWRHFAVITDMDWDGSRLIRWHREKQGTVEPAHGIIKNELAGGAMPCGRFGSNAAWWRINVLAANLLELVRTLDPSGQLKTARPKALRFRLLNLGAEIKHQARQWTMKLFQGHPLASALVAIRKALASLAVKLGNLSPSTA